MADQTPRSGYLTTLHVADEESSKGLHIQSMQLGSLENRYCNVQEFLADVEAILEGAEQIVESCIQLLIFKSKIFRCKGPCFCSLYTDTQLGTYVLQTCGRKKDVSNKLFDDISQLQDLSTGFNLGKYKGSISLGKSKKAVKRDSVFSIRELMNSGTMLLNNLVEDGFGGRDTKYEHSDETWREQIHCINKNITYEYLFGVDDASNEIGFIYPKNGAVHNVNDNWGVKMISKLQDKSTGCNLNWHEEPFRHAKRRETMKFLSCLIAAIMFLWIIFDTCTNSSIIQVHSLVFIWSSFLEPFCFMLFIWAVVATIVVGAPLSRKLSAMLMFWAIWMLVRSAKSITEVYVPILGILFTGCCVLMEKQPERPN